MVTPDITWKPIPMPSSPHLAPRLPQALYRADQVRELDRIAIQDYALAGGLLMERAGAAAYQLARGLWPAARHWVVTCGIGNNGGDGYVVARLAHQDGLTVQVLQLGDGNRLAGDALAMASRFRTGGGQVQAYAGIPPDTDLIVDGLFGTGLEREVSGGWAAAIRDINGQGVPVLALDIPSGLHSDSGRVLGEAVRADATISFIGLKQGLFTGQGPDLAGQIYYADLDVPSALFQRFPPSARRLAWPELSERLPRRRRDAHKGDFGHVLVVGGAAGYSGAARLAGEAALRAGAGLVTLGTDSRHAALLNLGRPELMCRGLAGPADLDPLMSQARVVAIGPGLGQSDWGRGLLERVLTQDLPLVVDADALNLLAQAPQRRDNWVLTPHPGEAARLLGISSHAVQQDRLGAAHRLADRYGGVQVLKGAGTLVQIAGQPAEICQGGNPGMASGGMGDLLTGVIAALIAQGLPLADAARLGVCLHGAAGDRAALAGERGLIASDLLPEIRRLVNPGISPC